ncbi:hypothetical protein FNH05_18090 [Amycolatopsis rhizosphaerae]|uniref:WXG100 family type VII secretion target n=1 Tax=Amycolatopsis rhizosphaerae TaxID=2053003 RepID=A0A558CH62_9PSEU|nr:pore-forming ESAT-6 family protein [Amycolatopsis rhizosphaerae]TVT48113.1 hypothetical protein FNH05_18090 [Amycolatopsis rhizosphaerae]
MSSDRLSYDTGASQHVQGDLAGIVSRLEATISQRSADVRGAMADFTADGVAEEYHVVEDRWNRAATEVRSIISLVKTTLMNNDQTAAQSLAQARSAVQGIG